jgi:hypothetical protein
MKRVPDFVLRTLDFVLVVGTIEKEGSNPNAGDHSYNFRGPPCILLIRSMYASTVEGWLTVAVNHRFGHSIKQRLSPSGRPAALHEWTACFLA